MGKTWDRWKERWASFGDLFRFLWSQRLWWMIPLVMMLLVLGFFVAAIQESAIAPFIYAMF